MRQQSMKAHPNSEAAGNPPKQNRQWPDFPANHEKRNDRAGMKNNHEDGRVPLNDLFCFAVVTVHQIS
jgi:hypothetical protein